VQGGEEAVDRRGEVGVQESGEEELSGHMER
jgi:hypothetical protein